MTRPRQFSDEERRQRLLERKAEYRKKNREKLRLAQRAYYLENKESCLKTVRDWHVRHPEKVKAIKARHAKTPIVRIRSSLRARVKAALKQKKSQSILKLIGCSLQEFKLHLQSLFKEGMTFDNFGEWHIDHIKPLCKFDLNDPVELLKACHYTNLQPLWAAENLKKGSS